MKFSTILKGAAAAAAIGGLAFTTAGAASASTTSARQAKPVEAITKIVNRQDGGGGGGPWAYDSFTRDLKVYYLGKSSDLAHASAPFMYWAQVSDTGTFRDMPGALTPNQGGHNAGRILRPGQVTGPMTGGGQWGLFYASAKAHNGLAPTKLRGVTLNAQYPSYNWPTLAFPATPRSSGWPSPGTTTTTRRSRSPSTW
jgi:hypothetical protein